MSESVGRQGEARRRYRLASGGIGAGSPRPELGGGDHVDDLAAAYALDALDRDEREAVEQHIRFCRVCADLVAGETRTVSFLPFTAPTLQPAPDVKLALFARIAHAQQAAAEAALPTQRLRSDLPPTLTIPASRPLPVKAAPEAAVPTPHLAAEPVAKSRFRWLMPALGVPLLVALIATAAWTVQLRSQVAQRSAEVSSLQATLANFASGPVTSYSLSPGPAAAQAEGSVVIGPNQTAGMVTVDLNSHQTAGQPYQVYVMQDGKLVPKAQVRVNEDGQGSATFPLDGPAAEYQGVEIKAEPLATGTAGPDSTGVALRADFNEIGSDGTGDYPAP